MTLLKFVENYLKEHDVKLLPHQKSILKSMIEGRLVYAVGGRHNGRSVLASTLQAYEERDNNIE